MGTDVDAGVRTCKEPPRLRPPPVTVAGADGRGRPVVTFAFSVINPRFHNGTNFPPSKVDPGPERRSLYSFELVAGAGTAGIVGEGARGDSDQDPEPPVNRGGEARRLICDGVYGWGGGWA